MRVEQWVKNLFVFAPLFFSGNIMNAHLFYESLFAFVVFSFTASSIYILNDYVDIESDKKHPEKKTDLWLVEQSPSGEQNFYSYY